MLARCVVGVVIASFVLGGLSGCTYTPNYFRETGPSVAAPWDSPTASDVKARFAPAPPRMRPWPATAVAPESGAVVHWPLYFEDPFVDKGHGRTDESDPHNVYRGGWEDYVAALYNPARFTLNWLLLPASAVVTPPWTPMESDGFVSRQLLGYDHDAIPLAQAESAVATTAASAPLRSPVEENPHDPTTPNVE